MDYFKLKYIEITQNLGTFYLTKMTPFQLHKISNKNLSRYKDAESGLQREISLQRTKDIKEYLKKDEATFPNTIIIAIQKDPESSTPSYIFNDENSTLDILAQDGVANILDGQHRLSGFEKNEENFELPVAIFLDLSLGEQAKIFAKINSTQAKVSLDLVYELFNISETRNLEKSAFSIVSELNNDNESPWFNKIKTLSNRKGSMAQGSFAKYIHKELISEGKILENLFKEERENDLKIMLMNFFKAVEKKFPNEWNNNEEKYILRKTTGFVALMSLFKDLVMLARNKKEAFSIDYCFTYINKINNAEIGVLTSDNYESGAKGQAKLKQKLNSIFSEEEKELLNIK